MRIAYALAAAALLATAAAALARPHDPQAEMAKALKGRVPGKPVNCIFLPRIRNTQIIDRTAILYDAGDTIYVNRPRGGAQDLSDWDVLVTKTTGSQLCSIDIVRLYERGTHVQKGFVNLGEFVPYTRVRAPRHR